MGAVIAATTAWYQTLLLREETQSLRETLNEWQRTDSEEALQGAIRTLFRRVRPEDEPPATSVEQLARVDAAVESLRTTIGEHKAKIQRDREHLRTVVDAGRRATERVKRLEEQVAHLEASLQRDENWQLDQEVMTHVAVLTAERDQLRNRLQQLLRENAVSGRSGIQKATGS